MKPLKMWKIHSYLMRHNDAGGGLDLAFPRATNAASRKPTLPLSLGPGPLSLTS